jgi:hypothetical protein
MVCMNVHPEGRAGLFLNTTMLADVLEAWEVHLRMPPHPRLVRLAEATLQAAPHLGAHVVLQHSRYSGSKV